MGPLNLPKDGESAQSALEPVMHPEDVQKNKEEENVFKPVIFICDAHPSLGWQPPGEHYNFTDGLFICDTPELLKKMEDFLRGPSARYIRSKIIRADDNAIAMNVRLKNIMARARESAVHQGPYSADIIGARNQELERLSAMTNARRAGVPEMTVEKFADQIASIAGGQEQKVV